MHLALQMATQAVKDHVDGILVQDIGLASEIRKNISYAGLHASTQMSVSNHYGVKVLHDMGFQRVVLARELNYQEANAIKQICLESNDMSQMEIEVFIHGGLCIAYSGQCFSSSYCFGSSANRGRCLMTCWKGYELKAGKKVLERGSLLRPRDLEGLYGLKHLMEGEIDCLKIQGRLRNSNYIGEIVNVYRHAIDDIFEKRESENKKKIYNSRLWAVSPRGLTSGNLLPEADRNLIMDFMIRSREDIALCRDKLKNIKEKQVIEIWYCKNVLDREKVYGRMQFSLDELFPRIVVRRMEIVWGDSARMIERYPNLDCAFAAVEIAGWGKNFRVIDMIQADKSKTEIKEMIDMLLNILSNYQSRIINLGEFVNECGCLSLCIEFSYTKEGKFTIIDWDSDNDMNVINKISHEQVLV